MTNRHLPFHGGPHYLKLLKNLNDGQRNRNRMYFNETSVENHFTYNPDLTPVSLVVSQFRLRKIL